VSLPYQWLDAEGVAAMLCKSVRHFRERIAPRPDFPKPCREKGLGVLWNAAEVDEWVRARRDATGGRPRQSSKSATDVMEGA